MKVLLFGCNGQLGRSLADTAPEHRQLIGRDLPELDIRDAEAVLEICREQRPQAIVNAAAYTAVDKAEADAALAAAVNVAGARNIALASRDVAARLIHISTDFVFDGKSSRPYTADAATHPLSVYGRTKRDGERAVLAAAPDSAVVVRTSWLYSKSGSNFVKTVLRLLGERDELHIVADQRGSPTWANALAQAVWGFVDVRQLCGVFHWCDAGETSWHEFALAIQEQALSLGLLQTAIPIHPIAAVDYATAAARPAYSVLDSTAAQAALTMQPAHWRANLQQMLTGLAA